MAAVSAAEGASGGCAVGFRWRKAARAPRRANTVGFLTARTGALGAVGLRAGQQGKFLAALKVVEQVDGPLTTGRG